MDKVGATVIELTPISAVRIDLPQPAYRPGPGWWSVDLDQVSELRNQDIVLIVLPTGETRLGWYVAPWWERLVQLVARRAWVREAWA